MDATCSLYCSCSMYTLYCNIRETKICLALSSPHTPSTGVNRPMNQINHGTIIHEIKGSMHAVYNLRRTFLLERLQMFLMQKNSYGIEFIQ